MLAACIALLAERLTARGLSRRTRQALRMRVAGPSLGDLLLLLLCDVMPVIAFATGLRAHRATGEIKQDGGGEQKEQGFLKHAA